MGAPEGAGETGRGGEGRGREGRGRKKAIWCQNRPETTKLHDPLHFVALQAHVAAQSVSVYVTGGRVSVSLSVGVQHSSNTRHTGQ